jgi:histidine triad (HIT) family protein
MNTDCIFCKIIVGEIPSYSIRETEHTYAFLDINPVHPGHTLVVPKEHATDIFEIPRDSWEHVMNEVHSLAPAVRSAAGADGLNIVMNNRRSAGQLVDHVHIHIIPRFNDDGLHGFPQHPYQDGEAEKVRDAIVRSLT